MSGTTIIAQISIPLKRKYGMCFISSMPWVTCGQEKGVPAKEVYFPRGDKNKITAFICLINHGISPSNM